MKKRHILPILAFVMMLVATATTVSAEALGESWTIGGYNPGWILVGIAVVLGLVGMLGYGNIKKFGTIAVILLLIGGLFLIPFETADTPPAQVASDCCPFEVTGSAVTSGTSYISDTTWDEDTLTLTVPLTVSDSSDGNLSNHKTGLNLTVEPMCSSATADDIETICFDSDYLMKYGGEYLLDEDSTGYSAIWTTTEGTEYYDDCVKVTADSSDWAQIDYTFVNATSGSWVSELDQIGDSKTWYITVSNDCYTETITVQAIVVSYTA